MLDSATAAPEKLFLNIHLMTEKSLQEYRFESTVKAFLTYWFDFLDIRF